MNEEVLKRLIEKYYSGESTEDEENALGRYFSQDDIPEGYEAEKEMFRYYVVSGKIPEPSADFEARIISKIDVDDRKMRSLRIRRSVLPYLSAAAGLLILAGSYFIFIHRGKSDDTFTDPQIAYAETMKILYTLSAQINKGSTALEPVSKIDRISTKSFEPLNGSSAIIEKKLRSLNYLNRAIEIVNAPVNTLTNK